MLHTETVSGTTLQLLKSLQNEHELKDFHLAGGTALALYLGHRQSIDLDLFSSHPFDVSTLRASLEGKYGFRTDFSSRNTLKGTINGVKIDCIGLLQVLLDTLRMKLSSSAVEVIFIGG